MPGNTSDKTTLAGFVKKIEAQYGKSERVWVMDRGIPTEETLTQMRQADPPIHYLVGTPRGRLSKLEKAFLRLPWEEARESVEVKLLDQDDEIYILAKSTGRVHKERAMRRRRLKRLWKRLHELQGQKLTRDQLLLKLLAIGQVVQLRDIHIFDCVLGVFLDFLTALDQFLVCLVGVLATFFHLLLQLVETLLRLVVGLAVEAESGEEYLAASLLGVVDEALLRLLGGSAPCGGLALRCGLAPGDRLAPGCGLFPGC